MTVLRRKLGLLAMSLTAGLCLAAWPATAGAAELAYRNNLKSGVIVESASIVRGRLVRDTPLLIAAGKVRGYTTVPPGPRIIHVFDAKMPSRLLFKWAGTVNNAGQKFQFSIEMIQPAQGGPARPGLVVK